MLVTTSSDEDPQIRDDSQEPFGANMGSVCSFETPEHQKTCAISPEMANTACENSISTLPQNVYCKGRRLPKWGIEASAVSYYRPIHPAKYPDYSTYETIQGALTGILRNNSQYRLVCLGN